MQDEVLWLRQTLAGDRQAFNHLVRKYWKSIYTQNLSIIHNHADAEELTNDAFIEAYLDLPHLRRPSSFYSWLRQIARHRCQDWLRQRKEPCLSLEEIPNEIEEKSAADQLIQQEKLLRTLEAIEALPEIDRSLMQDFYLEAEPYKTLQERYHLSKAGVKMRLFRARQKVKNQVEKVLLVFVSLSRGRIGKLLIMRGGLEVVKIAVKVKLITAGVVALLTLGSILLWYSQESGEKTQPVAQVPQEVSGEQSGIGQGPPSVQEVAVSFAANSEQDEVAETAEEEWWDDLTDEEWEAMDEFLSALDALDEKSADEQQAQDDEAAQQADIAYWRQELQNITTDYCDVMDEGRALGSGPGTQREKENLERERVQLLLRGMDAIFYYVTCSDDYSGVNAGGWVDDIWGYYVKVRIYPPSVPGGVPEAHVLTPLVLGGD